MKKNISTIGLIIMLMIPIFSLGQNGSKKITLDDIFRNRTFRTEGINEIRSMKDGVHYTALSPDYKYITKYSYKTGDSIQEVVNVEKLPSKEVRMIVDYEFNDDETAILIQANYEQLYRRSFKADYFIYDIVSKTIKPLSKNGKQQLATFSPDGKKIAFVRDNNMFVVDLTSGKEVQITTDGKSNEIINGAPDWVYEEEFEFNKAFAWSPDSKHLAYMKFDERGVKMFNMTMFQGAKPSIEENALYPSNTQFKYPKAGEDNSIVNVFIYDLSTGKTIGADTGEEKDQYIPRIMFTKNPETLAILRLNRLQNKLEILKTNAVTGKSEVMYTEENKYYIDEGNFDYISFSSDGKSFVLISEQDGWSHLYQYDMNGKLIKQLTKGEFDVTDYYGYDEAKKLHYYQAAAKTPMQRELYSVKSDGTGVKLLSEKPGTNRATFSSTYKYYIHNYSSATEPPIYTLREASGKQIRMLEDNSELKNKLNDYKFNHREFFIIDTPEGIKLNAYAIYPPDFDKTKKYPVVINQYSGPNSQQVLDSWSLDYDDYLAQEGFILVSVDPRGTGARGEEFRKGTYLQLGKYETIDHVNSAKYLANLPGVDGNRIGIWGWSYGGFISSSCMLKGNGTFKVGVAVAPVTNWRYYDNIYTERFMRKPQDNKDGYDSNSPLFFADKLQGKLLLVHGTADDNVHVQNTLELAERLVQAEKQFDMMVYTNRNHSIFGGNTRMHLHTMITNYFKDNL